MRFLPLLLGLALVGCAHLEQPLARAPDASDGWRELVSDHFVLQTDLPADEARLALADFEESVSAFEALAFPWRRPPQGRIHLVLFARELEFRDLAPTGASGYFMPHQQSDVDFTPTIAMPAEQLQSTRRRFQHELTHRFLTYHVRLAPPWLEEGLAEYFSTLRLSSDGAIIGELPMKLLFTTELRIMGGLSDRFVDQRVSLADVPTLPELLGADHGAFHDPERESAFYAAAWVFVHMLENGPQNYQPRLSRYVDSLAKGLAPAQAWVAAFGDIPLSELDREYREYIIRLDMRYRKAHYQRQRRAVDQTQRRMSEQEVHLLLARTRPWDSRENILKAGEELKRAFAIEPVPAEADYLMSLYHQRWRYFGAAAQDLKRAIDKDPRNPRYLLALAEMLDELDRGDGERITRGETAELEPLVSRLSRVADTPQALNFIARYHAERGDYDAGIEFARRAVRAGPDCWECFDTFARLRSAQVLPVADSLIEAQ